LFGNTVVPYGWYFQVILLFYLIFYIAYRFFKKRPLLFIFKATIAYMLGCGLLGLSTTWYECAFCFDLGFLFFYKKDIIMRIHENKWNCAITCILSVILFSVCFVFGSKNLLNSPNLTLMFKIGSTVLFVVSLFTIVNVVNLKFNFTELLSKYYLEIYLFQGMVYILCRNRYWGIENQYVYFITAIVGVLVVAMVFHPAMSKLMEIVKTSPLLP